MKAAYHLVDVFTNTRFGGNQLAVFPDAKEINPQLMQSIARELNLSETVFVLPASDADNDFRLRIFTPAIELPMAGHPTVGTAFVLANAGIADLHTKQGKLVFEEGVGPIEVTIEPAGLITMKQPLPQFGRPWDDVEPIAEMLSVDVKAITETGLPVQPVSCGVPFLYVPLRSLEDAHRIEFRREIWNRFLKDTEAPQVFAFTLETGHERADVHSRMFAPALNIPEDPATGSASGPLGCYLMRYNVLTDGNTLEFVSEQGIEMGRPSFINVIVRRNQEGITNVVIGGHAVHVGQGFIQLD
jgi:trans-2,3-dihydro-3-hydroxyanthranilate isomerase